MFPGKNYILGVELANKMGVHIANISIAKKTLEDRGNFDDIIKLGQCTYINPQSKMLPKYIKIAINKLKDEFTDVSNKLPMTYVTSEFKISKKDVYELCEKKHIFKSIIELYDKILVEFNEDIVDIFNNHTTYIVNSPKGEYGNKIIPITNNRFLVWY